MTTEDYTASFDKLIAAADTGDQAAVDALDAMAKAADDVAAPAPKKGEQGLAEAQKRFGSAVTS